MKRILSSVVVLAMVLSTVGALTLTSYAADAITIDDMPGNTYYTQNFEGVEAGTFSKNLTGWTASDGSTNSSLVASFKVEENTVGGASNKALAVTGNAGNYYLTEEEYTDITNNGQDLSYSGVTYRVIKKTYGGVEYYIGFKKGTDRSTQKLWFAVDDPLTADVNETTTKTNSKNQWFKADGTPYVYNETGKSTGSSAVIVNASNTTFPAPTPVKIGGNVVGNYTMSYDLTQYANGSYWNGNDYFTMLVAAKIYYITKNGLLQYVNVDAKKTVLYINDAAGNNLLIDNTATMLGEAGTTPGIVTDKTQLTAFSTRNSGETKNVMVNVNFNEKIINFYYDGKPVYWKATGTEIYSKDLVDSTMLVSDFPGMGLSPVRYNTFTSNPITIDNITLKYNSETIDSALAWENFSNGQLESDIIRDINLKTNITVLGVNYPVVWTSDNAAITTTGNVVRGAKDTAVTLTATAGGKTKTHNVTVSGTDGTYDINSLPGEITYQQDFDDISIVPGASASTISGLSVDDGNKTAMANTYIKAVTDTASTAPETSNRVLGGSGKYILKYLTVEEFKEIEKNGKTVTFNSASYIVKDYEGFEGYYIGYKQSLGRQSPAYWFKKATDGTVDALGTNSTNYWFNYSGSNNGKPVEYNQTGKTNLVSPFNVEVTASSVALPTPVNSEGLVNGEYFVSFDYAFPNNENVYYNEDLYCFVVNGKEFYIRKSGFTNFASAYVKINDDGTTAKVNSAATAYIAKDSATTGLVTDLNLLKVASFHNDMEYHNILIKMNLTDKTYQICYDGRPIFFRGEGASIYSSTLVFPANELTAMPSVQLRYTRHNTFVNHMPVTDNIVIKYAPENLSNEEKAQLVLNDITLPYIKAPVMNQDIIFDEKESEKVSWSFDNSGIYTIDSSNPSIARINAPVGFGTSDVVLTASATVGGVTKTKDFTIKVKNNTPYLINSVVMKKDGQRVYVPSATAVLEKINVTKYANKAASVYVSIYDKNDELVKSYKKPVSESGDVAINHTFNDGESYRVFVFDGTLRPCSYKENTMEPVKDNVKMFMIGDSIAQTYGQTSNLRGVGQMLGAEFTSNVTFDNTQSVGGRSCKYSLTENRLNYVLDNASKGNYLLIQLGHNDEKTSEYYGSTTEEFEILLLQMVNAAKDKGIIPVLLSPVVRPYFTGEYKDGKYTINNSSHAAYTAVIQKIANEHGISYIDANKKTQDDMEKLGPTYRDVYFNPGDTHLVETGAIWAAGLVADGLKEIGLPVGKYVK